MTTPGYRSYIVSTPVSRKVPNPVSRQSVHPCSCETHINNRGPQGPRNHGLGMGGFMCICLPGEKRAPWILQR